MGNLGGYQTMTEWAKKLGGPGKLVVVVAAGGWAVLRLSEAGVKKVVGAIRAKGAPCETKGLVFRASADGAEGGATIRSGNEYRVLECDGDAILIEVVGDTDSPYFVSSKFLQSISGFPKNGTTSRS